MRRVYLALAWVFIVSGLYPQYIVAMGIQKADSPENSRDKRVFLEVYEDDVVEWVDSQPSFGLYKDTYFITGVPLNEHIDKHTADAKFQISIKQRLTKSVLPLNTYLMLTFTQKAFWNIYEKSSPFDDINFNPGLVIGKAITSHKTLRGMVSVAFEHESNGKDSTASRSWNYFVLSGSYFFDPYFSIQLKAWPGWAGTDNPDIYEYRGYCLLALNYHSLRDRFWATAVVNPRNDFKSFNTQLELNFKISPKQNQYLFVQWYQGYGESLLEYNKYTSMVRAGFCIKPPLRNFY